MALRAFLDANVLYPVGLRDSLLWIARFEVYSPLWSPDVLDEMGRNVLAKNPKVTKQDLAKMREDMASAFEEAEVTGYQTLIGAMPIVEHDRHVLAAAVAAKATILVTNNKAHFPADACATLGIDVASSDEFLVQLLTLESILVHEALRRQASIKRNPPMTLSDVLAHLERTAPTFVREARLVWGEPPSD